MKPNSSSPQVLSIVLPTIALAPAKSSPFAPIARPFVLSPGILFDAPEIQSFEFGPGANVATSPPAALTANIFAPPIGPLSPVNEANRKLGTRIKPPEEMIKLEDRLYYVLQPSLESLIARGSLEF